MFDGTTVGRGDGFTSGCGGAGSPDLSFRWVAPMSARYRFAATSEEFEPVVGLRVGDCGSREADCASTGAGPSASVSRELSAGTPVIVVVDGRGAAGGRFVLGIELTAVSEAGLCGDAVDNDRDGATDCDDPDCAEAVECATSP